MWFFILHTLHPHFYWTVWRLNWLQVAAPIGWLGCGSYLWQGAAVGNHREPAIPHPQVHHFLHYENSITYFTESRHLEQCTVGCLSRKLCKGRPAIVRKLKTFQKKNGDYLGETLNIFTVNIVLWCFFQALKICRKTNGCTHVVNPQCTATHMD